jgi:hypothetical protein
MVYRRITHIPYGRFMDNMGIHSIHMDITWYCPNMGIIYSIYWYILGISIVYEKLRLPWVADGIIRI